jgi:hypothetical protein
MGGDSLVKIKIIEEAGYLPALLGMGLSFGATSSFNLEQLSNSGRLKTQLKERADKLFDKGLGHNKFLESIVVWLDVTAPLYWWKEADTYRLSTKQSESTIHSLMKKEINKDMFEGKINISNLITLEVFREDKNFDSLNKNLPHSFLQRRIWCMNYMCLRNIIQQRKNHKLDEWKLFCKEILEQAEHSEFLK